MRAMIMVLPSSSSSGWLTLSHPLPPPFLFGGAAAAAKTAMSRVLPRVVMCLFYDGDMTGPRCCPIRDCRLTKSRAKRTKFEEHTHSAGPSRHIRIWGGAPGGPHAAEGGDQGGDGGGGGGQRLKGNSISSSSSTPNSGTEQFTNSRTWSASIPLGPPIP
mmetsp:Transcript_47983/g.65335  ORF Transcript_47983/g.65335 Transcript_47983/m.65335 type:complete len:160 (-) Transcript_47983:755-1234(-)